MSFEPRTINIQHLFDREPPVALEAEKALLGAMLIQSAAIDEVRRILAGPQDFSNPAHAAIYETMATLWESGVEFDAVSVRQALADRNLLDQVGGGDYLAELYETVPSAASAPHHAHIVHEKALIRRWIESAGLILDDCYNQNLPAADIAARARHRMQELAVPMADDHKLESCTSEAAHDLWDTSPEEIRAIFYCLKNPSDPGRQGILLSDPCKLLLAYAIAGTFASKKIVVSNDHMLSAPEHFYTNHFCFFINNSGDSKTGTSGIVQEFVETYTRSLRPGEQKLRLECGMATGPVIVIKDCFGIHDDRIKSRAVGTGRILPRKPGMRKDEPDPQEVTAQDMIRAREEYKRELWSARDCVEPMVFVVDELAEKLANVAKIAAGSLIDIHASGPHVRIEGKYNSIGTCYGYGSCISIFGNMQKSLAAQLFYNSKNSASGLQGRCLPLSNDFQAHIVLGDSEKKESQHGMAQWLAGEFGSQPINGIKAHFPSFDDSELRESFNNNHGIEYNKFHVMTQRLLAPLFAWGSEADAVRAYGPCLRLLAELYPHAFDTGICALAKSTEREQVGRTAAVVRKKLAGKTEILRREILQSFRGEERQGRGEEVDEYMSSLRGWRVIPSGRSKGGGLGGGIKGWIRVK